MFVRGLPEALTPGRVELQPLGSLGRYVKLCHSCKMFSPSAYLCECKHVYCTGCAIVEPTWEKGKDKKSPLVFCTKCKSKVSSDYFEVEEDVLGEMHFACPCGLNGPLREIKKHLWSAAKDHPVTVITAQFSKIYDQLADDVTKLKTELSRVMGVPTKKYFWINLGQLIQDQACSAKGISSGEPIPWEVSGYTCEFFCQVKLIDNDRYIGVFFRTSRVRTSRAPWPMKKLCIFNLYDINGRPIKTGMIDTFKTGQRVDADLMAPSTKKISGRGLVKFYKVLTLVDKMDEVLVNGRACFSAELREI
ncbi:hypothetical protein BIW11_05761 [Tropilaelaps mercedesae]|uniref:RING-type domain-containing protein n=1 Tax=Tropilaelaps mercedesae TaxID=418985 RepID=A0A1V9Y128_9ACAR|nr:hypothetical protein BIW11_05761 [Tropilaelaps mercedesae]OQR79403.1 hypothetical protein BIW11_05761 [Tropilaelaps mercedesae]